MSDVKEEIGVIQRAIDREEASLAKIEAEAEPIRERVRKLRAALKDLTSGSMGSGNIGDDVIVGFIKKHGDPTQPLKTPDIARGLDVDGRGLSRRLQRMARSGMIAGSAEAGYYVGKNRVQVPA